MSTPSLIDTTATRTDRLFGVVVALLLAAATAWVFPYARHKLAPLPAFMPMFAGIMAFSDFLTAYVLLSQGAVTGSRRVLFLGGLYLFCALIIIPHLLTFPGVFDLRLPFSYQSDAAVWLWVFWHAGFSLGVLGFCLWPWAPQNARATRVPLWGALAGAVLAAGGLAAVGLFAPLPSLLSGRHYDAIDTLGITRWLIALQVAAVAAALIRLRARTLLEQWLTVAAFEFLLDVVLTLHGTQRYSVGWYAARLNSLAASTVVLSAFLYQMGRLYNELVHKTAELGEAHEAQRSLNRTLSHLAQEDPLTNLFNRRGIQTLLEGEWRRWERYQRSFAVLMIDADHFKAVNDRYGHATGDAVLQALAGFLRVHLRAADLVSRYGGEEFLVLLPETQAPGAAQVAETLRARLAAEPLTASQIPVTVSIGVATADCYADLDALLAAADAACYEAKAAGRNRIATARSVQLSPLHVEPARAGSASRQTAALAPPKRAR